MSVKTPSKLRLHCLSTTTEDIEVSEFPFLIGRDGGNCLTIHDRCVSKRHAQIESSEKGFLFVDCNSTNGSFVNGHRVSGTIPVVSGDIIQISQLVYRLDVCKKPAAPKEHNTVESDVGDEALALLQFDRLFSENLAEPHFQPIVHLQDRSNYGFEVLARSSLYGLQNPAEMFAIARKLNLESELSEVFRRRGVEIGQELGSQCALFLNSHPSEMDRNELYESLDELRNKHPNQRLVFEIHEEWSASKEAVSKLKAKLEQLDIGLAFDDFGVGQARLIELANLEPDYLKFDKELTQNIEHASQRKLDLIGSFTDIARKLGIKTIAEGIETDETHRMVRHLGVDLGQGYLYGHPRPINRIVEFMETLTPPMAF